jgi:hypothetical protein
MNVGHPEPSTPGRVLLHPSVGVSVDPQAMNPAQKVAAVAKVRCLEHDLYNGDGVRRRLDRREAEHMLIELNQLRLALGWLEVDGSGQLRWPHKVGTNTTAI